MFKTPLPLGWVITFTAAGVVAYWARWGRDKVKIYGLSRVMELLPLTSIWRARLEFLLFVGFACLIGIGVVQPINVTQSLTAGFAWVALFTNMQEPSTLNIEQTGHNPHEQTDI